MDSLHALLLAEHDKVLQQIDVLKKKNQSGSEGNASRCQIQGKIMVQEI